MDIQQFMNIVIPTGTVIVGYFSILSTLKDKIDKKNEEQDNRLKDLELLINQNKSLIEYERRLTIEQQKSILKRVKYKLLSQDEKIDNLLHYIEVLSKSDDWKWQSFRNRTSRIDMEFTRSLMSEDDSMSGDLNSETLS